MDFNLCCRGCMEEVAMEEKYFDDTTVKMFTFCTNIEVSMEDRLPRQFCKSCTDSIQSCFSFITTARDANISLRYMLLTKNYKKPTAFKLKFSEISQDIHMKSRDLKSIAIKSEPNMHREEHDMKSVVYDEDKHRWMEGSHLKDESKPINVFDTPQENTDDYKSTDCPQNYKTEMQQHRHTPYKRKRPKGKEFQCAYCNKMFSTKSHMMTHLHVHDSTLKKHLCDVCGSRFSSRQAMLNHRLVHSAMKPYTCEQCGYSSRVVSNLRRHRRAHLNQRNHVCLHCGKGFNEPTLLKKHMYVHTGERPYKCPHCENAYKSASKRKTHIIRVHGMDPSEIPRMSKDGGLAGRYVTEESTRTPYSLVADRNKEGLTHAENET